MPYADYGQWEAAHDLAAEAAPPQPAKPARSRGASSSPPRLSYREQKEWDQMEAAILEAEERMELCRTAAEDPAVATDHKALHERHSALAAAQATVEELYARWAELEAKMALTGKPAWRRMQG
jgi:ATP-binding cassette subfamily F protein uup